MIGLAGALSLLLCSCASIDPAKVDVELPETAPEVKVTNYTQALKDLGMMTEIYDTGPLKIQSNPIGDNTGTSGATGGEIPRDITEMLKSSLNSIGGNVIFIPYDPAFIQNQMVTGYSNFDTKLIPDVVVSGGITEFDRGLETRGKNTDFGVEASFTNAPSWAPSKSVAIDYGEGGKTGLSRITLDFNLLDFKTMAGISRMNTVNSMEVTKALSEKELGITLFGPTFGRKGSIKKVQGRHAAVRLLVEVSMIQMVGKHLVLPYWRVLGDGVEPDEVVMTALKKSYYRMTDPQRIYNAQQWLFLYGYDVRPSGTMDAATQAALQQYKPGVSAGTVDVDTFVALYVNLPIDEKTYGRRTMLANLGQAPVVAAVPAAASYQAAPAVPASAPQQAAQPAPKAAAQAPPKQSAPAGGTAGGSSIGRILKDEDW
jgi:hypothetical protein